MGYVRFYKLRSTQLSLFKTASIRKFLLQHLQADKTPCYGAFHSNSYIYTVHFMLSLGASMQITQYLDVDFIFSYQALVIHDPSSIIHARNTNLVEIKSVYMYGSQEVQAGST